MRAEWTVTADARRRLVKDGYLKILPSRALVVTLWGGALTVLIGLHDGWAVAVVLLVLAVPASLALVYLRFQASYASVYPDGFVATSEYDGDRYSLTNAVVTRDLRIDQLRSARLCESGVLVKMDGASRAVLVPRVLFPDALLSRIDFPDHSHRG